MKTVFFQTSGLEPRAATRRAVAVVVVLLVNLPADPRRLQARGIGRPAIACERRVVLGHVGAAVVVRAVVGDGRDRDLPDAEAVSSGEQEQAVGAGGPMY